MELEKSEAQQFNSKSDGISKVKVALRVRPMISKEKMEGSQPCITCYPSQNQVVIGKDRNFTFENIFEENSKQNEIYDKCVKDLVIGCFEGYNATVLAYGQTGSGKTYTMGSSNMLGISNEDLGIIPRVINQFFAEIERRKDKAEFLLKASFLEIYNEEIKDLLDPAMVNSSRNKGQNSQQNSINIREEKDGSISIYGVVEEKVNNKEEMLACLERGSLHRSTATTLMNESSSRSHAIFTIFVEQHSLEGLYASGIEQALDENGKSPEFMTAKFHFVDLAGSERIKKTGATGSTLKEGISINRGLLSLGNVIAALTDKSGKTIHVPYRESKLTRILQDSLGGNAQTYMIACVSPAESNFEESLNTIKYASRARNIKNNPVVNRDPHNAMITQLKQQIFELQHDIQSYKKLLANNNVDDSILKSFRLSNSSVQPSEASRSSPIKNFARGQDESSDDVKSYRIKILQLEKQNKQLQAELQATKKAHNESEISFYSLQRERDTYRMNFERAERYLSEHNIEFIVESSEDGQKKSLIEEYLAKLEKLKSELFEKERTNKEIQAEYESLLKTAEKDNHLLLEKTKEIQNLKRKILIDQKKLLKGQEIREQRELEENHEILVNENQLEEEEEEEIEILSQDVEEELQNFEDEYSVISNITQKELRLVDGTIQEKEELLKNITENQMLLEKTLVEKMKQQYHHKIASLEIEIKDIEKQRDRAVSKLNDANSQENTKIVGSYKQKISDLQNQLKDFKRKEKEQASLMKLVQCQERKITDLDVEIKSLRNQKILLSKKMREETEKFEKFRQNRVKELIEARKKNLEKDQQISKLMNENKRKSLILKKKEEELINRKKSQNLINKIKFSKNGYNLRSKKQDLHKIFDEKGNLLLEGAIDEEKADIFLDFCIKKIVENIELEFKIEKDEAEIKQTEVELSEEQKKYAELSLKKERVEISMSEGKLDEDEQEQNDTFIQELKLQLDDINSRIEDLEEGLRFKQQKVLSHMKEIQKKSYYHIDEMIFENSKIFGLQHYQLLLKNLLGKFIPTIMSQHRLNEKLENKELEILEKKKKLEEQESQMKAAQFHYEISLTRLAKEYEEKQLFFIKQQEFMSEDTLGGENEIIQEDYYGQRIAKRRFAKVDSFTTLPFRADASPSKREKLAKKIELNSFPSGNEEKVKKLEKTLSNMTRTQQSSDRMNLNLKRKVEMLQNQNDLLKKQIKPIDGGIFSNQTFCQNSQLQISSGSTSGSQVLAGSEQVQVNKPFGLLNLRDKRREEKEIKMKSASGDGKQSSPNENRVLSESNINFKQNMKEEIPNKGQRLSFSKIQADCIGSKENISQAENLQPSSLIPLPNFEEFAFYQSKNYEDVDSYIDKVYSLSRWEKYANIENAHNGGVFVLKSSENTLYSASIKTIKIWSLETLSSLGEINAHNSFIKALSICPERKLLVSASEKLVSFWDTQTYKNICNIKAHKDEVRALYTLNENMFVSAGRGSQSSGALMIWDMRNLQNPIEERDKNQDIFALTHYDDVLYYGGRDHYVKRLNLTSMDSLSTFEEPHHDAITSLIAMKGALVSGSKDKHLRLWNTESSYQHLKFVQQAHHDYIYQLENGAPSFPNLFYSCAKDGKFKVWSLFNDKIRCVSELNAHTPITSLCKFEEGQNILLATGSLDYSIKIWRPNRETNEALWNLDEKLNNLHITETEI